MHRTSSKARSLKLQRETVRVLASSDLASVEGGALQIGGTGRLIITDFTTTLTTTTTTTGPTSTVSRPTPDHGGCGSFPSDRSIIINPIP